MVGRVGLREFVCPPASDSPAQILPDVREVYPAESPAIFAAEVLDSKVPRGVTLHWRRRGETSFHTEEMRPARGYRYVAAIGPGATRGPVIEYYYTAEAGDGPTRYPVKEGDTLESRFESRAESVIMFAPEADAPKLAYTRIGDNIRHGISKRLPANGADPAALRIFLPMSRDMFLDDYTVSLSVKPRLAERELAPDASGVIHLQARGCRDGQTLHMTLVESDGTSWSAVVVLGESWRELNVPLDTLRLAEGVKLPLGFPGRWSYWLTPAKGRGGPGDHPRLGSVEHLQFSLRPEPADRTSANDPWIDLASVSLGFEKHQ
jgi:hypothetical protein